MSFKTSLPSGIDDTSSGICLVFGLFTNILYLEVEVKTFYEVGELLQAVSRTCCRVQGLALWYSYDRLHTIQEKTDINYKDCVQQLEDALKRWYLVNSGLRLLSFQLLPPSSAALEMMMRWIASYCPRLEHLCACTSASVDVTVDIWLSVWQTCLELRSFQCDCVRWDATLCRAFVLMPKPKLEKFVIEGWDWEWGREEPTLLDMLATSMPNLKILYLSGYARGGLRIPSTNATALDYLLLRIAEHCPFMELVSVSRTVVTSIGIKAIASIRYMSYFDFDLVDCDRNLLVELFKRVPKNSSMFREFRLRPPSDGTEAFLKLLQFLNDCSPDEMSSIRLNLHLSVFRNGTSTKVKRWSQSELENLVSAIRLKHGSHIPYLHVGMEQWGSEAPFIQNIGLRINVHETTRFDEDGIVNRRCG